MLPSILSKGTVYTFLATLVLLLSVSAAIVIRSFVLRRRHRQMVEEAIRNGTWVPPAGSSRAPKVDLSKKPKLWEAYLGGGVSGAASSTGSAGVSGVADVDGRSKNSETEKATMGNSWLQVDDPSAVDWDSIKPFSASYLQPPPQALLDPSTTTPAAVVAPASNPPNSSPLNDALPPPVTSASSSDSNSPFPRSLINRIGRILHPTNAHSNNNSTSSNSSPNTHHRQPTVDPTPLLQNVNEPSSSPSIPASARQTNGNINGNGSPNLDRNALPMTELGLDRRNGNRSEEKLALYPNGNGNASPNTNANGQVQMRIAVLIAMPSARASLSSASSSASSAGRRSPSTSPVASPSRSASSTPAPAPVIVPSHPLHVNAHPPVHALPPPTHAHVHLPHAQTHAHVHVSSPGRISTSSSSSQPLLASTSTDSAQSGSTTAATTPASIIPPPLIQPSLSSTIPHVHYTVPAPPSASSPNPTQTHHVPPTHIQEEDERPLPHIEMGVAEVIVWMSPTPPFPSAGLTRRTEMTRVHDSEGRLQQHHRRNSTADSASRDSESGLLLEEEEEERIVGPGEGVPLRRRSGGAAGGVGVARRS